jgi:ferritin
MSVTKTRSLNNLFMFKESKKRLTMDFVRDFLLDQFNECEETRSLVHVFTFRESKKRLTMDFVGVPFS